MMWVPAALLVMSMASDSAAHEASFLDAMARRAYAERRYDDALEDFLLVEQIAPSAANAYNIALAADLVGDRPLAFSFWSRCLAHENTSSERRTHARKRRAELARVLAVVRVRSTPPGATIYVDRRALGAFGTTPHTLVVEPGEHSVELVHDGFVATTTKVTAVVGEQQRVDVALAPQVGSIRITGAPLNGRVRILGDGGEVGTVRIGSTATVAVGTYRLVLDEPTHRPAEASVRVMAGQTETRQLRGEPLPRLAGRLLVATDGVVANLFVDGVERGRTPTVIDGLEAKTYALELRADGHRAWRGQAKVTAGRGELVRVTLEPR